MFLKRLVKTIAKILLGFFLAGLLILGLPRLITVLYSQSRLYTVENAPAVPVAIVFGAGLNWDGTPSPVLRDRVMTAANLYFAGKVTKLLVSGDNRFVNYNEPKAMRDYAIELGVPEEDIVQDFAGRSTYDTCYRAIQIFGIKDAIIVTQAYHLSRALFTCNQLGVHAVGVAADLRDYPRRSYSYWVLREFPATLAAIWNIYIAHPEPVMGNPETIQ